MAKVRTSIHLPNEVISASNMKLWLRTWSNDLSSGVNYIDDNFTLTFQTQSGTVATTSGSAVVTGSGTSFTSADVGKRIRINGVDRWIASVQSTTQVTLNTVWMNEGTYPATAFGQSYSYGLVGTWKDKSGGGYNFTQATNNRMPFLILDKNLIRVYSPRLVDSSGQFLENTSFDDDYMNGTSYSVFSSCIPRGYSFDDLTNQYQSAFSHRFNNISSVNFGYGSSGLSYISFSITDTGGNYFTTSIALPDTLGMHIPSCGYVNVSNNTAGMFAMAQKKITAYTGTIAGAETGSSAMLFASRNSGSDFCKGFKGYINEVIFFNTVPVDQEAKRILHYITLKNKY